jgi:hypothetical protein
MVGYVLREPRIVLVTEVLQRLPKIVKRQLDDISPLELQPGVVAHGDSGPERISTAVIFDDAVYLLPVPLHGRHSNTRNAE